MAELIAISGSLAGQRFFLPDTSVGIGRAPSSDIVLPDLAAAWHHCLIEPEGGRFRLSDLHTGGGTYVNGFRTAQHWLEKGDQISVGESVFAYQEPAEIGLEEEQPSAARITLLRACTLLFLFKGMVTSTSAPQAELLENHALSLIAELLPCESVIVLLSPDERALRELGEERSAEHPGVPAIVDRLLAEGPLVEAKEAYVAVPVYASGVARGVIIIWFTAQEVPMLEEHLEIVSAISTLASVALENVREIQALRRENELLQEQLSTDAFGIVGRSASMRRLLQLVQRVGPQDTTVLVLGESGTGKELIARAVHQSSPRRNKPFVAINCAALTETLLESELFGHEKGAFTGAIAQKKGKLEAADGGSVFLDEIGELAPTLQAKLLRVLQQREFERVGSTKTLPLNVRIVAATNRDLAAEVKRGSFREDLYHRLNVVALRTPSLRERPEDISLLAEHFLRKSAQRIGRPIAGISPEAERLLIRYTWPGNVRELENAMERGVVLSETEWLNTTDLPDSITGALTDTYATDLQTTYESAVGDARRDAILRAWEQARGDYKEAANLLGIHPNSLLRLIRKHGLRELLKQSAPR
ncbi:MAG: sigma 54-interacting transcriptional regulator [Bryobacteraceae bacterium]|nr:sigma 54-interacting transcriptional regulator [Bryobacteraceae bacterium]